jgi:hypothetical protein
VASAASGGINGISGNERKAAWRKTAENGISVKWRGGGRRGSGIAYHGIASKTAAWRKAAAKRIMWRNGGSGAGRHGISQRHQRK